MTTALLKQFPRFSEYDPGAVGEGSLDPLGFGAMADRIADKLAPGVRARMSQPRFVTLAAIGAFACQPISDVVASDGKTKFDLAFEWLVVESLVQRGDPRGVPGSQKARRALKMKQRLNASAYLSGPRVFGFTGVYRPFAQNAGVLGLDGLPAQNAETLIEAWERDQGLDGFIIGKFGSSGLRVRREIEKECLSTLNAAHVTAPPTGWLMKQLADSMAPRQAKERERAVLRGFVTGGEHAVRSEITALLSRSPPGEEVSEREIAKSLLTQATPLTAVALAAAIEFENCATAIEYAFKRLLAYATSLGGAFSVDQGATGTPHLGDLAPRLAALTKRAIDAVTVLDESLAHQAVDCFAHFDRKMAPSEFIGALIARHQQVQEAKGKRMWIDPIKGKWVVRPPYRSKGLDLSDDIWMHPMRLNTLAKFLRATA